MAANIFQVGGGNNWNSTASWSLGSIPTASDGHVATFNATSPNCTVNVAAVCNNIDFTGYTNTITMTNGITVSGNITLISGLLVSGTGALTQNTTGSLTSGGFTWPNAFTLSGTSSTHTLIDDWRIAGNVTLSGNTAKTINGLFTLRCDANLTLGTTGTITSGTATIQLGGTGTWSHTGSSVLRNNLTINTAGTITFGAAIAYNTGTFTYTAGTIDATTNSNTFTVIVSTTLNVNSGIVFNNFTASTSGMTLTLGGDLWIGGNFTSGAATSTVFSGAFNVYMARNMTIASNGSWNAAGGFLGIIWNGSGASGVWSGAGNITTNLTINGSGTLTISGSVSYRTGTFLYTAGTVVTTGSTLNLFTGTLNTNGISWNNVTASVASMTVTLSSVLTVTGTLTIGATAFVITMNGSNINLSGNLVVGFTTGNTAGTTTLTIVGNSTWTMPSFTSGTMRMPIIINNSGFTFTLSGSLNYSTGTITYTDGTVSSAGGTLNMAGTLTVNNPLTITNLVCAGNTTFNGTNGLTITNWTCTNTGLTHTFKNGLTYTIATSVTLASTLASPKLLQSDSAGNQAIITFPQSCIMDIGFTNATDINSSNGRTAWTYKGTLSNATNWRVLPVVPTGHSSSF